MALQLSEVDGGKDFIFSYSMQYNFTEKKKNPNTLLVILTNNRCMKLSKAEVINSLPELRYIGRADDH